MIRVLIILFIAFVIMSGNLKAAYNPFSPAVIKVTNTALANANSLTVPTQFNNINTSTVVNTNTDVFTSVDSDGVNCIPGTYMVDVSLYQTSTAQRTNVAIEVTLDSVSTGTVGANGYIRSVENHNDSTSNISDTVRLTSAGKIGFQYYRLSNTGTVAIPSGQSSIRITRIKD
jgi:hypothetical protein